MVSVFCHGCRYKDIRELFCLSCVRTDPNPHTVSCSLLQLRSQFLADKDSKVTKARRVTTLSSSGQSVSVLYLHLEKSIES